jgi:hypothetical protein
MSKRVITRTYPFAPGEAIVFQRERFAPLKQPLCLVRAVVERVSGRSERESAFSTLVSINEFVTVRLADGRRRRMKVKKAAHAGFCLACATPAHQSTDGALICPQCGSPANTPPPDLWIVRAFGEDTMNALGARLVAQALATPDATGSAIWERVHALDSARKQAMADRFGVSESELWGIPEFARRELEESAIREDVAGYQAHIDAHRRRGTLLNRLLTLLSELDSEAQADLPMIALLNPPADMPADDRTPDGDDDLTRWLAGQVERHEQRKAA